MSERHLGMALAAGLGLAAALAFSCGDISDTPGSGGRGGSAMTGAGAGGGAGLGGMGGGGGAVVMADAGPDMGGAGGAQGGSGGLPPDCPVAAPTQPAGILVPQVIAIQSVNINTSEIVLRNISQTNQTVQVGRQGWQWCMYPRYWAIREDETSIVLAPGKTLAFIAINNQSGPAVLYSDEGELAMYPLTGVFEEYEEMQAFAAWGEIQAFRESYAVQRGVWTFGERIQIQPGHAGFIATGPTDKASGYTSVRAACLVAPPNP